MLPAVLGMQRDNACERLRDKGGELYPRSKLPRLPGSEAPSTCSALQAMKHRASNSGRVQRRDLHVPFLRISSPNTGLLFGNLN